MPFVLTYNDGCARKDPVPGDEFAPLQLKHHQFHQLTGLKMCCFEVDRRNAIKLGISLPDIISTLKRLNS